MEAALHSKIDFFFRTCGYLEEEAEADPLVVSDISPLLWVYCLVDAGVSNINTCTAQSPSQSSSSASQ